HSCAAPRGWRRRHGSACVVSSVPCAWRPGPATTGSGSPTTPATATRRTSAASSSSWPALPPRPGAPPRRPTRTTCRCRPAEHTGRAVRFLQDGTAAPDDDGAVLLAGTPMKIHEVFPYLCVSDAEAAIRFYGRAFGATEKFRLTEPGGRIGHAELAFGPMTVMLSDEFPECGIHAPTPSGPAAVTIHLHVDDCDAMIRQAVAEGAVLEREPS